MPFSHGSDIRARILWVVAAFCAVVPTHIDAQATPVSIIEIVTAEVPASRLAEEERPDHDAMAQAPLPSEEVPETRGKTELGSGIFNPLSQPARERSGASGEAASSVSSVGIAWEAITLVAVLVGVVAVVLLAYKQESDSNS